MKIEYNIICVNENSNHSDNYDATHHGNDAVKKYKKRKEYIKNIFIPTLKSYDVVIFDAITKNDFILKDNLVYFDNFNFKVNNDWNTNCSCLPGQISLVFSNYLLWKKSIKEDKIIIICEDDVEFLTKDDINYTTECVNIFSKKYSNDNSLLYLQSFCPWKNCPKTYDLNDCKIENEFYFLNKKFYDLSGTACYAVTPSCAEKIINYIKTQGIFPIDQIIIKLLMENVYDVLLPKHYFKNCYISRELQ